MESGILTKWFSWKNSKLKGQRNAKAGLTAHLPMDEDTVPDQSSTLSYLLIIGIGNGIALVIFITEVRKLLGITKLHIFAAKNVDG